MPFFSQLTQPDRPERNNRRIGWILVFCSIGGGWASSYSGLALLVYILPQPRPMSTIIPFLLGPLIWACTALWISTSTTRLQAVFRSLLPTSLFAVLIFVFIVFGEQIK